MLHANEQTSISALDHPAVSPLSQVPPLQDLANNRHSMPAPSKPAVGKFAGPAKLNCINILETVQAALREANPYAAIEDRLNTLQAAQQAKFASLLQYEKEDYDNLMIHESVLKRNYAVHRAALKLLRMLQSETTLNCS